MIVGKTNASNSVFVQELEPRSLVSILHRAFLSHSHLIISLQDLLIILSWLFIPVSTTLVKFTGVNTPTHSSRLYLTDGNILATPCYKQLTLLKSAPHHYLKHQEKILKQAMDLN